MDDEKKKKNKKKKNKQTKTSGDVTCGVAEPIDMDQNHVIQENHDNRASANADVQTDELKTDVDMDGHFGNDTGDSALAEAEKPYWMDREAGLEETIRKLQTDNDTHVEKEARLEETITRLQKENYAQMEKAGSFETKLSQLQNEKDSWLQKEAAFHGEINGLIEETTSLSLNVVSLEEKIKQMERERVLRVEKENSMEETIACLNSDKTRLEIQVMELEESRNSLLEENLRLTEILSGMQSQIQSIEKSIVSSSMAPVATMGVTTAPTDIGSVSQVSLSGQRTESREEDVSKQAGEYSDEIVQIPLDDNKEQVGHVSLTDAQIIGAPFRLIYFMARYVSGKDLIK